MLQRSQMLIDLNQTGDAMSTVDLYIYSATIVADRRDCVFPCWVTLCKASLVPNPEHEVARKKAWS